MALFFECSLKCARKVLDTADIVRETMFHQLTLWNAANLPTFIDEVERRNGKTARPGRLLWLARARTPRRRPTADIL